MEEGMEGRKCNHGDTEDAEVHREDSETGLDFSVELGVLRDSVVAFTESLPG
jgi:hypothetical protein